MIVDINKAYETWCKTPQLFSIEQTVIIKMYQDYILNDTGFNLKDIIKYSEAFELILKLLHKGY